MFAANPHPTSSKRREVLGWGDNPSHLLAAKVEMDVVGGKCERHQSGKSNILTRACDSISILSLPKICVRLIGSRTVVTATFRSIKSYIPWFVLRKGQVYLFTPTSSHHLIPVGQIEREEYKKVELALNSLDDAFGVSGPRYLFQLQTEHLFLSRTSFGIFAVRPIYGKTPLICFVLFHTYIR